MFMRPLVFAALVAASGASWEPGERCAAHAAVVDALRRAHGSGRCEPFKSGNSGALIAQTNAVLDTIAARVSELDAGDGISSDGLGWFAHRFGGGARNYTYEYINSKGSFCTGRGPKGKLNTFECFFEPTCAARRDAAASGAPPPAWPLWARALPQLDWMAAVAAFALRPSAALRAEIARQRAVFGHPAPGDGARVVALHLRRGDKIPGGLALQGKGDFNPGAREGTAARAAPSRSSSSRAPSR